MVTVTKMEAASRQLDTAIQLFFSGGDSIAIHSLATAAANVFADIAERKESVSWRTRTRDSSGLSMKELKCILHNSWNFFKHADSDTDGKLIFNEQENQDLMFMAVLDCGELYNTSCAMQAFQLWYIAAYPHSFSETDAIFSEAQKLFPAICGLSYTDKINRGAQFFRENCTQADVISTD